MICLTSLDFFVPLTDRVLLFRRQQQGRRLRLLPLPSRRPPGMSRSQVLRREDSGGGASAALALRRPSSAAATAAGGPVKKGGFAWDSLWSVDYSYGRGSKARG